MILLILMKSHSCDDIVRHSYRVFGRKCCCAHEASQHPSSKCQRVRTRGISSKSILVGTYLDLSDGLIKENHCVYLDFQRLDIVEAISIHNNHLWIVLYLQRMELLMGGLQSNYGAVRKDIAQLVHDHPSSH